MKKILRNVVPTGVNEMICLVSASRFPDQWVLCVNKYIFGAKYYCIEVIYVVLYLDGGECIVSKVHS